MGTVTTIPPAIRERTPLITPAGYVRLDGIRQHGAAPKWNFEVGDRLEAADLPRVAAYRRQVFAPRTETPGLPPWLIAWINERKEQVPYFRRLLAGTLDLASEWATIPTMTRETIACHPEELVPPNTDLERLIVYDTSGTTGHALVVPHHPLAVAKNHCLVEYALAAYGRLVEFDPSMVACVNVCAQQHTYVFCNVFSVWNQAGFAKVNLNRRDWAGGPKAARTFMADLAPHFITADPVTIAEMIAWELPIRPAAIFSTALTLSPAVKTAAEAYFDCPVIDWYSTTETGPLAAAASDDDGYLFLAPDIYLEVVDDDDEPVPAGEWGEITVSGGRNPYLPLLRYRTGDQGRMAEGSHRLQEIHGRKPVFFRSTTGTIVNPVDISRAMRLVCPFVQHSFIQRRDGSCDLLIRPVPNIPVNLAGIEAAIYELFGSDLILRLSIETSLGDDCPGGKAIAWQSELEEGAPR